MTTVVIPARMASSRFPDKPLASILGLPMIEHVRRRALLAPGVDLVVVATCDESIRQAVEAYGGKAVMTKDTHVRCTDRVEEAMQRLPGDIVVIVQGDEPLLLPESISQVAEPLRQDTALDVVNLLSRLDSAGDYGNPDIVKAVCDQQGDLIFLTRAPVPHFRVRAPVPVFRQTGIMAFRAAFLRRFSELPETPLERAESVDILRVLEHGIRVAGVVTEYPTIGVDRPADLAAVEVALREDGKQRELFNRISG